MKRLVAVASAVVLGVALAAPAMAQMGGPVPGGMAPQTVYGKQHPYVRGFDSYLDQHPNVARDLSKNPHLVDSGRYLAMHPDMGAWLRRHPRAAREFRRHPDRFMSREHRYNRGENRRERAQPRSNVN